MKNIFALTTIGIYILMLTLITGCNTVATNQSEIAVSQKEMLLTQAGFRVKTVTTATQQQRVSQLAQGRVSAIKYQGKLYYVYPSEKKNQIYVGRQAQFNAYKQALAAQKVNLQNQQQMAGYPVLTEETAGPNHIEVQEFDGFGPLGMDTGAE
jgi:hypothetical protein